MSDIKDPLENAWVVNYPSTTASDSRKVINATTTLPSGYSPIYIDENNQTIERKRKGLYEVLEALRVCDRQNYMSCPYFDNVHYACCGYGKQDLIDDALYLLEYYVENQNK